MKVVSSISEIVESLHNKVYPAYNFSHYMGDFLDKFYREGTAFRNSAIKEEPVEYEDIPKWQYSYLAASVHLLCLRYKLKCPKWALSFKYVLKDPKFAMDAKGDLRLVLILESPYPFKARNLFVPDNVLSRV